MSIGGESGAHGRYFHTRRVADVLAIGIGPPRHGSQSILVIVMVTFLQSSIGALDGAPLLSWHIKGVM